jgi:hypothetical protein
MIEMTEANLLTLTSKDLRNLGKEYHIKEYWNLDKATIVREILAKINAEATPETPKTEPTEKRVTPNNAQSFEYRGKSQSLRAWATELHMEYHTLYDRINRLGWEPERALSTPCKISRKKRT